MKNLRQITKIIMTPDALKAVCVTTKGTSIAIAVTLMENEELKKLVDEFSLKLMNNLEKEIS